MDPCEAWEPWDPPAVNLSDGPVAVYVTDPPDLDALPRSGPVGFTASR